MNQDETIDASPESRGPKDVEFDGQAHQSSDQFRPDDPQSPAFINTTATTNDKRLKFKTSTGQGEEKNNTQTEAKKKEPQLEQQEGSSISRFLAIHLFGSIEWGSFESVNDVYIKYSIVTGPDWILCSGTDVGVSQISRFKLGPSNERKFVWNQPIAVSFRSYNFHGWPQIVLSVYYFDRFGNDQILGYGCAHLPISSQTPSNYTKSVSIYSPQSSSFLRQILSWITGKKPELVDSNLFARGDCRSLLQLSLVGRVELSFNLTTKDILTNGYRA